MTDFKHRPDNCYLVLVEDSQDEAEILQELMQQENIFIDTKHFLDGQSAYQYLSGVKESESRYLVVLDLNLPKMDGKEILQKLKADNGGNSARIVVFSGSENPADKKECLETGAHSYYVKPWHFEAYKDFVKGPLLQELRQACACY